MLIRKILDWRNDKKKYLRGNLSKSSKITKNISTFTSRVFYESMVKGNGLEKRWEILEKQY